MASDLFDAIDALFKKEKLERFPPFFIMHRFLASNPQYAIAARYFQREFRDQDMLFAVWQGILPKANGAPRLNYVAPKKEPPAEKLVAVMVEKLHERRHVVEEMIELFEMQGREKELYQFFGVDPEE